MVGVSIEFRNNSDILQQLHRYRDDNTFNEKYSDIITQDHTKIFKRGQKVYDM